MIDPSKYVEYYKIDQPFYWYEDLDIDKVFPIYYSLEDAISAAKFEQSKCLLDRFIIKKYHYIFDGNFLRVIGIPVYQDPGTLLSLCANAVYTHDILWDKGEIPRELENIMKNLAW
jgi:hypothetical protein